MDDILEGRKKMDATVEKERNNWREKSWEKAPRKEETRKSYLCQEHEKVYDTIKNWSKRLGHLRYTISRKGTRQWLSKMFTFEQKNDSDPHEGKVKDGQLQLPCFVVAETLLMVIAMSPSTATVPCKLQSIASINSTFFLSCFRGLRILSSSLIIISLL